MLRQNEMLDGQSWSRLEWPGRDGRSDDDAGRKAVASEAGILPDQAIKNISRRINGPKRDLNSH
jgi:hypothetical protein